MAEEEISEDSGYQTGVPPEFDGPEPMDESDVDAYVGHLLEDAIDYIDELSEDRITSTEYYSGHLPKQDEDGRSSVVSYDVRDTVNSIMPVLMRTFFGSKQIMQFTPRGPEDVEMAQQATDYINHIILEENQNSFSHFYAAFKDCLIKRTGILKYWYEKTENVSTSKYTGLDEAQVQTLAGADGVEGVDAYQKEGEGGQPLYDVIIKRRTNDGRIRVEALPPEEFIIDRRAKNVDEATVVGHRSYKTLSELQALGHDIEELEEYAGTDDEFDVNQEYTSRHSEAHNRGPTNVEPASRKVLYIECFMNLDVDQDGISELRRLICVGNKYHVIVNEPCDYKPFVLMTPDPEPHAAVGSSITDIVADIQRVKSYILRNVMESLAMSVTPRLLAVEGQCSLEDVMNTEPGGIIRARNPAAVSQLSMPFVGQQALPILGLLDEIKSSRTGITKQSQGMDAESLQSSSRVAIDATFKAAAAHMELLGRILAETAIKPLYKGVLGLVCRYQDREKMIRLRNNWVPMDPRYWDASMDVTVDIPLGGGSDSEKLTVLSSMLQKQEQLIKEMGPEGPLVNLRQYYQTLGKMLNLGGYKDVNQFFSDPANYQPPPPEPPKPTPDELFVQAQMQKVQSDMINDQAKLELDREKMLRDEDMKRDQFEAELQLKISELESKHNTTIDQANIRAMMERDREMNRQQTEMAKMQLQQQMQPQQPQMPQ